jgi:hypothetical protein
MAAARQAGDFACGARCFLHRSSRRPAASRCPIKQRLREHPAWKRVRARRRRPALCGHADGRTMASRLDPAAASHMYRSDWAITHKWAADAARRSCVGGRLGVRARSSRCTSHYSSLLDACNGRCETIAFIRRWVV